MNSQSKLILNNFEALGTRWWIEIFDNIEESEEKNIVDLCTKTLTAFDKKYSRFKKDSLVTKLNNTKRIAYDYHLRRMIDIGNTLSQETEGYFNLYIEKSLIEKGYGNIHENTRIEETIGYENDIRLQENERLDLGGIGKGYVIDLITETLRKEFKIQSFLINGGGDMYIARKNNEEPLLVYLDHPKHNGEVIGTVLLKNQSLAGSSSFVRQWEKGNKKVNHFITKDGNDVWCASFVIAPTATYADVLATCACVMTPTYPLFHRTAIHYGAEYMILDDTHILARSDNFEMGNV